MEFTDLHFKISNNHNHNHNNHNKRHCYQPTGIIRNSHMLEWGRPLCTLHAVYFLFLPWVFGRLGQCGITPCLIVDQRIASLPCTAHSNQPSIITMVQFKKGLLHINIHFLYFLLWSFFRFIFQDKHILHYIENNSQ